MRELLFQRYIRARQAMGQFVSPKFDIELRVAALLERAHPDFAERYNG